MPWGTSKKHGMIPILPDRLLSQFSECIAARLGLYFPKERWRDLQRAIGAIAQELQFSDADVCVQWLLSSALTRHQIEIVASHLTVGETYFFREKGSFDALETHILRPLIRSRQSSDRHLYIWSAGCSTGEEAYSVAILLNRLLPDRTDWDITILATDINPRSLRKASLGIYDDWSFRDSSPALQEEYFRRTKDGCFEIMPQIKALVTFAYLNLADDVYPSVESNTQVMDIVLCRNVLMYFEPKRAQAIIERLCRSLVEGGWLIVSPVETSLVVQPEMIAVELADAIFYRKSTRPGRGHRDLRRSESTQRQGAAPAPTQQEVAVRRAASHDAEGAEWARAVLAHKPRNVETMALLTRAYANQGRLAEAVQWCNRMIVADKLNPTWPYLLASILQEQGQTEAAIAALKRTLYLDHEHALAYFALGNLLRRQGRHRESSRHFRTALSILRGYAHNHVLPESEGITAGQLIEIIRSTFSSEGST